MRERYEKLYEQGAINQADVVLAGVGLPTYSQLVESIRHGDSLEELKRMIGPSDEERDAAIRRLTQLDALATACKWEEAAPDWTARQARERWNHINRLQTEYENQYL